MRRAALGVQARDPLGGARQAKSTSACSSASTSSPRVVALTVSCSRSGTRLAVCRAVHSSARYLLEAAAVASTAPFYVQRPGTGATGAAAPCGGDSGFTGGGGGGFGGSGSGAGFGTKPARAPRAASLNR